MPSSGVSSPQQFKRVICALSGGVDSAVSALLLRQKGHEVIGVHMVNWDAQDEADEQLGECTRRRDENDARAISGELKLDEFHVVNFVGEYWNGVFLKMLDQYRLGRTPVPDVDCNRLIKFGLFRKFAFEKLGADAIATGHYASTSHGDFLQRFRENERVRLLRPVDPLKDQTYFLSTLDQEQLRRVMFPVGSLTKPKVRELAEQAGLFVAKKEESRGICSVGKKDRFEEFLEKYIPPHPGGCFVDVDTGKRVEGAEHTGVHNFTIGKRITGRWNLHTAFPNHDGLFVTELDPSSQTVYFCHGSYHRRLFARRFVVSEPHWISGLSTAEILAESARGNPKSKPDSLLFTIQRTHPPLPCQLLFEKSENGRWILESWAGIRAAAPGQTCAFYSLDGKECLGSAEIQNVVETL